MTSNNLENIIIISNKKKNFKCFKLKNYITYKKNKIKKITLQDGIIKIEYDIKNLHCRMCSSNECYHIDYIYNILFDIDFNLINLLYCNNFNYDLKSFEKNHFYKYCSDYLKNNKCCYCLDSLDIKYELWCCTNCKNLMHNDCINKWIDKKNECPLCKSVINNFFIDLY